MKIERSSIYVEYRKVKYFFHYMNHTIIDTWPKISTCNKLNEVFPQTRDEVQVKNVYKFKYVIKNV